MPAVVPRSSDMSSITLGYLLCLALLTSLKSIITVETDCLVALSFTYLRLSKHHHRQQQQGLSILTYDDEEEIIQPSMSKVYSDE